MASIKFYEGSILNFKGQVDAMVNVAFRSLKKGGRLYSAVQKAAGPKLQDACEALGGCEIGSARITYGYKLCKYIIHAASPPMRGEEVTEEEMLQLRNTYLSILELATGAECKTIAIPNLGVGKKYIPQEVASKIACETIYAYLDKTPTTLETIVICYDTEEMYEAYKNALQEIKNEIDRQEAIRQEEIRKQKEKEAAKKEIEAKQAQTSAQVNSSSSQQRAPNNPSQMPQAGTAAYAEAVLEAVKIQERRYGSLTTIYSFVQDGDVTLEKGAQKAGMSKRDFYFSMMQAGYAVPEGQNPVV